MDDFTTAYIEAALWSSMDNSDEDTGGEPLAANYGIDDIAPEALATMQSDCAAFQAEHAKALRIWCQWCGETMERAGHDLWLTRNHHGAGYWDRWGGGGWPDKIGYYLTEQAHSLGSADLYIGADGMIYHS